jgi:uncharacterized protein YjbI with pentapeptide repeats
VSDELPPVRCDDPSTWRHKDEKIDLPRLLELIEENGGPWDLDLHGCDMSYIEASPAAIRPYVDAYVERHGAVGEPPWLYRRFEGNFALQLSGAHLESANLQGAQLNSAFLGVARLERATLTGAHLEYAELVGAYLEESDLCLANLENARVWGAHLENTDLMEARLENADLTDAHLEAASLWDAHLGNAILKGTRLHGTIWHGCYLDHTRIWRGSLGQAVSDELIARGQQAVAPSFKKSLTFRDAREAYLAHKANFDSIGRYADASWAYVKEQQMEKAMHFPTRMGHGWILQCMGDGMPPPWWGPRWLGSWVWWKARSGFYHGCLFLGLCPNEVKREATRWDEHGRERDEWMSRRRWVRNWAYELLSGYGEWLHMPLIWAVVVVLSFTAIYAGAGNVASGDGGGTHDFLTALTHSIAAFATVGFNTLEPVGWGARLLTAIEAMFGIGLFALFVFTLGNRMRRS